MASTPSVPVSSPTRIAIVGCGAAGLSAAYLAGKQEGVELTLFEARHKLGGHATTVEVDGLPVDCGFLVYNESTYPNMIGMYEELDVPVEPSDMSFTVSLASRSFEWGSTSLSALFATRSNIVNPSFRSMMADMLRFNKEAYAFMKQVEADPSLGAQTMKDFLDARGYGQPFRNWYLIPQVAAVWSASAADVLAFPAKTFIQFCVNHSLAQVMDRPQWRTVSRRSREYVRRIAASLNPAATTTHLCTKVTSVRRAKDAATGKTVVRITATTAPRDVAAATPSFTAPAGTPGSTTFTAEFDHVIFGAHPDEALEMLGADASAEERAALAGIGYQANTSYLHTDETLMPRNKAAWSSWNYIGTSPTTTAVDPNSREPCCVTYWLNLLQNLPKTAPQLFVTLNPATPPRADTIIKEFHFSHPQFNHSTLASQAAINGLQGANNTWFCGAYLGYGFHEDAVTSGLRAAHKLTGVRPRWWDVPLYNIPTALAKGKTLPGAATAAAAVGGAGATAAAASAAVSDVELRALKRAAGGPYWVDNLGNGGPVGLATEGVKTVLRKLRAAAPAPIGAAGGSGVAAAGAPDAATAAHWGTNTAGDQTGYVYTAPGDVLHTYKLLVGAGRERPLRRRTAAGGALEAASPASRRGGAAASADDDEATVFTSPAAVVTSGLGGSVSSGALAGAASSSGGDSARSTSPSDVAAGRASSSSPTFSLVSAGSAGSEEEAPVDDSPAATVIGTEALVALQTALMSTSLRDAPLHAAHDRSKASASLSETLLAALALSAIAAADSDSEARPAMAHGKKGVKKTTAAASAKAALAITPTASTSKVAMSAASASNIVFTKEAQAAVAVLRQALWSKRAFKSAAVGRAFESSLASPSTALARPVPGSLGDAMARGAGGYTAQEKPLQSPDVSLWSWAWQTAKNTAATLLATPVLKFLRDSIVEGCIIFRTPDGTDAIYGDPEAPKPYRVRLRVHSWNFFVRVASEADLGLARSFIAGEWTVDDLTALFNIFIANRDRSALSTGSLWTSWIGATVNYASFALTMDNSIAGSRKNIHAHYDLSNDLFVSFLDPKTMMYSCAFFDTTRRYVEEVDLHAVPTVAGSTEAAHRASLEAAVAASLSCVPLPSAPGSTLSGASVPAEHGSAASALTCCRTRRGKPAKHAAVPAYAQGRGATSTEAPTTRMQLQFHGSLEDAQTRKLDHLIARANVQKTDRVLDLGFGWSGLSIRLAETIGCKVHGITLSKEQYELASERVRARGLEHLITFEIVDYREFARSHAGQFDKIISVEMIEAVGINYFDTYFEALDTLLAPNGVIVIQAITIPESRFEEYASSTDFINTMIFPGGALPSVAAVMASIAKNTSLMLSSTEDFALHYAETLRRWRANFNAALEDVVRPLGFDDAFIRTWNYYLCYCEAGFATQTLGLHVLTFTRPHNTSLITGTCAAALTAPVGPVVNDPSTPVVIPAGAF